MKRALPWALSTVCLIGTQAPATERFVEIAAEIETLTYLDDTTDPENTLRRTFSVLCVVGTNQWRIENDFSRRTEVAWYYDGTNVYRASRITAPQPNEDSERLRNAFGLAPVPFDVAASNVVIRVRPSPHGHPLGDLGVNVPWLAFCSGPFLRRQGRVVPSPIAELRRNASGFAYADETETFEDELRLPTRVELFASRAHSEYSAMSAVLREYYGIEREDRPNAVNYADLVPGFEDGALAFRYDVTESTNFLGWNFPLRFEMMKKKQPPAGGSLVLRYAVVGTVHSIRTTGRPKNAFSPDLTQSIMDGRFHNREKGVESIVYVSTNNYLAPTNDPALQALFAARLERASRPAAESPAWVRLGLIIVLAAFPLALIVLLKRKSLIFKDERT